jgi:hypothetical protein
LAGFRECGDEPSGSGGTELVSWGVRVTAGLLGLSADVMCGNLIFEKVTLLRFILYSLRQYNTTNVRKFSFFFDFSNQRNTEAEI